MIQLLPGIVVLLTGSLLSFQPSAEKEFEVEAQPLKWDALSPGIFDTRWFLPEPRQVPGRDLLAEMQRLSRLRFDVRADDGRRYRCLGDLAAAARGLGPSERQAWLDSFFASAPSLTRDWGAGLRELLLDSHLLSSDWSPPEEHPRDGLLFADSWDMTEEDADPWGALDVAPVMEQAAALVYSDLAAIKAVENDYRVYPSNVGANYEEIYPLENSYFLGVDDSGRPFSSLTLRFRCDLPFHFSDYSTRLAILNRFDDEAVLRTDIYSTSSDFHWLAGRDVFLPIADSSGEWVAFLSVRHFGFDLDGVPDKSKNRRGAICSSLGNLKRNAEKAFQRHVARGGVARNGVEVLGEVRVLGRR